MNIVSAYPGSLVQTECQNLLRAHVCNWDISTLR